MPELYNHFTVLLVRMQRVTMPRDLQLQGSQTVLVRDLLSILIARLCLSKNADIAI